MDKHGLLLRCKDASKRIISLIFIFVVSLLHGSKHLIPYILRIGDRPMDGPMDGLTDGPIDGWTDRQKISRTLTWQVGGIKFSSSFFSDNTYIHRV